MLSFVKSDGIDAFFDQFTPGYDAHTRSGDYSGGNLLSGVNLIAENFELPIDAVQNYFNHARFAMNSRRAFHTFSMDKPNDLSRTSKLQSTIIKIVKQPDGIFNINVRQVWVNTKYDWNFVKDRDMRRLYTMLFNKLDERALTRVYQKDADIINPELEKFKQELV